MTTQTLFQRAERLAIWTVVAGCVATFLKAASGVAVPFQTNYAEGPLLGVGINIASGQAAYPASTKLPYVINPYGPLPYYLVAMFVKLFGVNLTAPRLMIAASGICCSLLIALLVRHWMGSLNAGLILGAVFLTIPTVQMWLVVLRVDMLGVMLSLAGLYLFVASRHRYLAVLCFVAALFCKFSFIAAPIACLIYLLIRRDWEKAFRFAAACFVMATAVFLIFQWESGGWFAFHTLWSTLSHPFNLHYGIGAMWWELLDNLPLLLLALLAVALSYQAFLRQDLLLPLIYFCLAWATMIGRGKAGGDTNYYLEWDAALCVLAGVAYAAVRNSEHKRVLAMALPTLLACAVLSNVVLADAYRFVQPHDYDDLPYGCRDAYQYVKHHPGSEMLTDNTGAAILGGKSLAVFEPFLWTRQVAGAGWSDDEVLEMVQSRKLDLILLGGDAAQLKRYAAFRWPRPVLAAIDDNYNLVGSFDCTDARFVYEPKSSPPVIAGNLDKAAPGNATEKIGR